MAKNSKENDTGKLFSSLWKLYNTEQYLKSVDLFEKRFTANGFNVKWFKGKRCLDAGCGSGRYTLAISKLGASKATGIDIGKEGLAFAKKMTKGNRNIEFKYGSALKIPFKENTFDFVCCSGVIMHTVKPEKAVSEIYRVLRKNGLGYFLVYGEGGLNWELTNIIRGKLKQISINLLDEMMVKAGFDANKRKNFLDNYFVPFIRFYTWSDISIMFRKSGFKVEKRWDKGQFDHEASFKSYLNDLYLQRNLFNIKAKDIKVNRKDETVLKDILTNIDNTVKRCEQIISDYKDGIISKKIAEFEIYGFGNHRFIVKK